MGWGIVATKINGFEVGDFARNVESGWKGKIVAFEFDGNGDVMAKMIGVDWLAQTVAGLSDEESLASNDVQWHSPSDLVE